MNKGNYNVLLEKSIILPQNNYRLANFLSMDKASANIVFLGGSITMGYTIEGQDLVPYPQIVQKGLSTIIPQKGRARYYNFSFSCFNSILGISLIEKKVLPLSPDLVFIEYAVNNGFDQEWAASFEGLIRRILLHKPDTAIIIVCCIEVKGFTCEPYMQKIATHYSLPLISIKNALDEGLVQGFHWKDYSFDNVHPSRKGHQLIGDCILELITLSLSENPLPAYEYSMELPASCYGDAFTYARYIGVEDGPVVDYGSFNKRLDHDALIGGLEYDGTTNSPFIIEIKGCTIYLIYEINHEFKAMGQIKVNIEPGNIVHYVDGLSIYGWGNPTYYKLVHNKENNYRFSMEMLPQDRKKNFTIYGFIIV